MRASRKFVAGAAATVMAVAIATVAAPSNPAVAALRDAATASGYPSVASGVPAAPAGARARTSSVTLITGDHVSLVEYPDGRKTVLVKHGPGRTGIPISSRLVDNRVRVVPADARPLLASGGLDKRLFDVSLLVESGYDDASASSLPLIVAGADGGAGRGAAPVTINGARTTRALPSIGASAVTADKQQAVTFWRALTGSSGAANARNFTAGVTQVWLDGRAELADQESNVQIGVPAAWQAGYNGKGVTVAVLDSGVDATHPDVKDVVTEARDFTDSPEGAKDTHGHGTHVASIIAGAGASNARYVGVAPGAKVIVGKVCGGEDCSESAIIAGMEWAASRAKVVNMSFGTSGGTDGTDPMAQAVNNLTATTGALFVAAAGNNYDRYTVGSPASADSALAVASVDRGDQRSDFSSQGPRVGDHAVKPDVAAPGEGIIAARAAGTSLGTPVDGSYTASSGTSMASPQVAGAAAIVAQAHPDWRAGELKAALMSSGKPVAGGDVYIQGAGRVDVARAVTQTVLSGGNVSFPRVAWPHSATTPVTRPVRYRNDGDAPVTLALAVSVRAGGADLPAGTFVLSSPTVTVPARGTAEVGLTLDPSKLPRTGGAVSARVSATGPGGLTVQTAAGVAAEPETFTVKITMLDRNGKPVSDELGQTLGLFNYTRHVDSDIEPPIVNGVATARVPLGVYGVIAETATSRRGRPDEIGSSTVQIVSRLTVDRDRTLTLDARAGRKVDVRVADRPDAVRQTLAADYILTIGPGSISGMLFSASRAENALYAVPTKAAAGAKLDFGASAVLGSPRGTAVPYQYNVAEAARVDEIPRDPSWRVHTRDLAPARVKLRAQGRPALAEVARAPQYLRDQFVGFGAWNTVKIPANRLEFFSAKPQQWASSVAYQRPADQPDRTAPAGWIFDTPRKMNKGKLNHEEWNRAVLGPSLALSPNYSAQVVRVDNALVVSVPMFSPATPGQGNHVGFQPLFARGETSLSRDGQPPATSDQPGAGYFTGLVPENARYTVSATATRAEFEPWSDLSTRVEGSWTFSSEKVEAQWLPLMYLRTTGALDDLNRAPAGRFTLTVDVARQPRTSSTATVREVTLEYSADDGVTWTKARVTGSATSWRAQVTNPARGYVSVRASVTDSVGDNHRMTVIRAYKVR